MKKHDLLSTIAILSAFGGIEALFPENKPAKVFFKATPEMVETRLTNAELKRQRKLQRNVKIL